MLSASVGDLRKLLPLVCENASMIGLTLVDFQIYQKEWPHLLVQQGCWDSMDVWGGGDGVS